MGIAQWIYGDWPHPARLRRLEPLLSLAGRLTRSICDGIVT